MQRLLSLYVTLVLVTACAEVPKMEGVALVTDSAAFSPRDSGAGAVLDGELLLLGGFVPEPTNEVWRSRDGRTWEPLGHAEWAPRNLLRSVVFRDRVWVLGGYDQIRLFADAYSSADGLSWQQEPTVPWGARAAFGLVELDGRLLLFGGIGDGTHYNDVWASTDGRTWARLVEHAPWEPRGMFAYAVFRGEVCLSGGGQFDPAFAYNVRADFADVWCSPDGERWEKRADDVPFGPRRFHRAVVLGDSLYVMAGAAVRPRYTRGVRREGALRELARRARVTLTQEDRNRNDVWVSGDGAQWELLGYAPFAPRHAPIVITRRDTAFVMGGYGRDDLFNDVWNFTRR